MSKKFFLILLLLLFPVSVFAHQPRMPEGNLITVTDPEVSKAYYSLLSGQPHIYRITSDKPFELYINLLVPDLPGQTKDLTAIITKDGDRSLPLAILDGNNFQWTQMFEEFGYDNYWKGPEYKSQVPPGKYEIIVSSTKNDSKYTLATGEAENFDFQEIMNALNLIPKIKSDFFNESPANFIFSPFGWGLILIMYLLSFLFGFVYRLIWRQIMKKFPRRKGARHNLGLTDRLFRAVIGIGLLILAITTSWNPLLLFLSGFIIFEAIFSWCIVYAALGRNSCPIN